MGFEFGKKKIKSNLIDVGNLKPKESFGDARNQLGKVTKVQGISAADVSGKINIDANDIVKSFKSKRPRL